MAIQRKECGGRKLGAGMSLSVLLLWKRGASVKSEKRVAVKRIILRL